MNPELTNNYLMPPDNYKDETDLDEQAFRHYVSERYKPEDIFDLYEHDRKVTKNFIEWVLQNHSITNTYKKKVTSIKRHGVRLKFTLNEMWEIYCTETKK